MDPLDLRETDSWGLPDLAFSFDPREALHASEVWLANASERPERGWARPEIEKDVREEHITFSWLLEPMLERADFERFGMRATLLRGPARYTPASNSVVPVAMQGDHGSLRADLGTISRHRHPRDTSGNLRVGPQRLGGVAAERARPPPRRGAVRLPNAQPAPEHAREPARGPRRTGRHGPRAPSGGKSGGRPRE